MLGNLVSILYASCQKWNNHLSFRMPMTWSCMFPPVRRVHHSLYIYAECAFYLGGPECTAGQSHVTPAQEEWRGCLYRTQQALNNTPLIWQWRDTNPITGLETPRGLRASKVFNKPQVHAHPHITSGPAKDWKLLRGLKHSLRHIFIGVISHDTDLSVLYMSLLYLYHWQH